MKFLGWDTSSKTGALVALEWDPEKCSSWSQVKLITEMALNVDSAHSERLLWGIHQTLEAARWKLDQVDLFGVGLGPGSFTGLRIGVTTARTMAHTLGKPLVGVSSLLALARPAATFASSSGHGSTTLVIASVDACKGELFAAVGSADEFLNKGPEEESISPEMLVKKLETFSPDRWIAVGEGRERYPSIFEDLQQELEIQLPFSNQVQGRYLGWLAWEKYRLAGASGPLQVFPNYLRASQAEVKLKAGLLAGKT